MITLSEQVFQHVPNQGRVIAAMQSPHDTERHLWLVLVNYNRDCYGTWLCDTIAWSYTNRYCVSSNTHEQNMIRAYDNFLNRCAQKLGKRVMF